MLQKKSTNLKVLLSHALLLITFTLASCGSSKVHKTFGFVNFEDTSELAGTYSGMSVVSMRHNYPINVSECFYMKEDEQIETFELSFSGDNIVIFSYTLKENPTVKKEFSLDGKKTKNGFIIYLRKNNILVPFVFQKTDVNQITIGLNTKGELIIENYIENSKGIQATGVLSGKQYHDVRVFEKIN